MTRASIWVSLWITAVYLPAAAADVQIDLASDGVTFAAQSATLNEVTAAIETATGVTFHLSPALTPKATAWEVSSPDIESAVRELLAGHNVIFGYARDGAVDSLVSVYVLAAQQEPDARAGGTLSIDPATPPAAQASTATEPGAEPPTVRGQEIDTLPPDDAIKAIEERLRSPTAAVRSSMIPLLEKLGGDRATMILGQMYLSDADPSVRAAAVAALRTIGTERSLVFVEHAGSIPPAPPTAEETP